MREQAHAPEQVELRLACALGYFELVDADQPPPARRWGCTVAECWVDAARGLRARYETLADSPLVIRLMSERAAVLALVDEANLACAHERGRWLAAPGGRLAVSDGAAREEVPWVAGPLRVVWFCRPDVSPLTRGDDLDFDPDAPHHVLLLEPSDDTSPPADMPEEARAYAEWYAIQQTDDAPALAAAVPDDDESWRALARLYRLRRLDAREQLEQLAAAGGVTGFVAGQLLTQRDPILGPETLADLPAPVTGATEQPRV